MVPGSEQRLALTEKLAGVYWFEIPPGLEKPSVGGGLDLAVILIYDLLLAEVPC